MAIETSNPAADVNARLIRHDETTIVVYIGDAPIEVRRSTKPGTFDKLAAIIDKASARD